jgi:hypothetical protein
MVGSEPAVDSWLTAEAEAVIRQAQERARRRRRRISAVVAIGATLLVIAGAVLVTEGLEPGRPSATFRTGPVAPGARPGTIVGVIAGCPGALTYPERIPTLGGVVTLLRGRIGYKEVRPGVREAVIPQRVRRAVAAIEHIRRGQKFSFREPAGHYVLSALGGDREGGFFRYPPLAVSLGPGATVRIVTSTGCA